MNRHGKALCLFLTLPLAVFANGQAQSQSDADPTALLKAALDKQEKAKESKTRFTYLDLHHTQNFSEKGKKTADFTQLFEVTYIADLQYSRLLEVDGKALKGKALDAEQKRYDDAVRERSALDDKARAKIQHQVIKDAGLKFGKPSDYRNTVADHAVIDGRSCVVVDSTPLTGELRKHYRVWIDPAQEEVLRMEFDQLADESDVLRGATGRLEWIYMDETPLLVRSHIDANTLNGKTPVHLVVDHEYTRFRRFSVSTKILAVETDGKQ